MKIGQMNLRPSLLISLRTTLKGGVSYQRIDLDAEGKPADQSVAAEDVSRWETTRIIADKEEYERAKKVRSKARSLITKVTIASDFGQLCTVGREDELDDALTQAQALIDAHNATATVTHVSIYLLKGRIASNDEEASKAIGAEVRDLINEMENGLKAGDVTRIREAADKARKMGQMLDETTADKVGKAVEEARSAAKAIVKRVETGGEDAALVIQELSRKALEDARFCFLDLDEKTVVEASRGPMKQLDLNTAADDIDHAMEVR